MKTICKIKFLEAWVHQLIYSYILPFILELIIRTIALNPDLQFKSSWPRRLCCLLLSSSVVVKIPHSFSSVRSWYISNFPWHFNMFIFSTSCSWHVHFTLHKSLPRRFRCQPPKTPSWTCWSGARGVPRQIRDVSKNMCGQSDDNGKKWQKDPKIETKYYKILQSNEKASTNHKKLHKKWIEHVLSKCSRVAVLWKKHEKAASDTSSLVIALLQFAHFFATPFAQLSWAAKAGPGQGIRWKHWETFAFRSSIRVQ